MVKMLHNELGAPTPKDSDAVEFLPHLTNESDDSQLLNQGLSGDSKPFMDKIEVALIKGAGDSQQGAAGKKRKEA